jgi:predicted Zn-dependent peptidase
VVEAPVAAPAVRYGWAFPSGSPDDRAALGVALEILAGSGGGRLYRLVVSRGLARRAEAWSLPLPGGVLGGVSLELNTRFSIDRLRRFVDGTLKQLRLVGPSRREFAIAYEKLRREALTTWEDPSARAARLAVYELSGCPADQWLEELKSLDSMTADSIRRFARTHFLDSRRTTVETFPPLWPNDDPRLARARLYTVAEGDTAVGLAERFHVPLATLLRENDLDPKYALVVGQPIWLPAK